MAKTETVGVRVTPEEKEKLQKLADAKDMSVSKYIYRILFPKGEE